MEKLISSFYKSNKFLYLLIAFFFLAISPLMAQSSATYINVTVNVYNKIQVDNNGKKEIKKIPLEEYVPFYWGIFTNKKTAEEVCNFVRENNGVAPSKYEDFTGISIGMLDNQVAFIDGYMYIMTYDFQSSCIVKIVREDESYEIKDDETDHKWVSQKKIKGKNNYEINLVIQQLNEASISKKQKSGDRVGGTLRPRPKNNTEIFPIYIKRDSTFLRDKTRFVVQTYAVDCITEDTVALCTPLVLENDEYHTLQNRRKDFNYMERDSLHIGYMDKYHLKKGDTLLIDTFIVFHKPKGMESRHFRGPYKTFLEDYHHVIDSFGWEGTCLYRDAWKFLNYGDVTGKIELSQKEFFEKARIKVNNVTKTLGLTYVRGKDVIVDNEENDSIKRELLHILSAYDVLKPKITGFSSPEGGYSKNEDLAKRRGRQAANFLRINCDIEPKVATWEDVAAELDKMNQPEEAAFIRQAISESKEKEPLYDNSINAKLKNRDINRYNEVIEPALEHLRKIEFSFGYVDSRPMEPQEAVADYYRNKRYFLSGDSVCRYSNGDFFNLYLMIKDEAEQDTITMLAYKKLYELDQFRHIQKFSPYVINRMALLSIKQGKPDSTILKPLIDRKSISVIDRPYTPFGADYQYIINRKEVVQNQALIMFLMDNITEADTLLSELKHQKKADATVMKFIRYVDLINFEGVNDLNDDEAKRYNEAKRAVLSNDLNKAILYSELPEWGKTEEARNRWINLLDDNDPRKWYLKGLAWVKDACKEKNRQMLNTFAMKPFKEVAPEILDSLKDYNRKEYNLYMQRLEEYKKMKEEDMKNKNLDVDNIPYYLAYFQHCFDLDTSGKHTFLRYYFNEGLVDDETRRQFPYKREDVEKYRKLFRMLKRYDNDVSDNLTKLNKQ